MAMLLLIRMSGTVTFLNRLQRVQYVAVYYLNTHTLVSLLYTYHSFLMLHLTGPAVGS